MAMTDSTGLVRRLSVLVESIHAVVYFAPEPQSAYAELGLRGYCCLLYTSPSPRD